MSQCPIGYFIRNWKVLPDPDPVPVETVGHVISITQEGDDAVSIACQQGHIAYRGIYNASEGRLEGDWPSGWTITCKPGEVGVKDKILYFSIPTPGSWSAEDNGGYPGGGEG